MALAGAVFARPWLMSQKWKLLFGGSFGFHRMSGLPRVSRRLVFHSLPSPPGVNVVWPGCATLKSFPYSLINWTLLFGYACWEGTNFVLKWIIWVFPVKIVSSICGRNCCVVLNLILGPRIISSSSVFCPSLGCGTETTMGVDWEDTSHLKCQPDSPSGLSTRDLWRLYIWYLRETNKLHTLH